MRSPFRPIPVCFPCSSGCFQEQDGLRPGDRETLLGFVEREEIESVSLPLPALKSIAGFPMTEERKHAILFAATILLARKLQPMLEVETSDGLIEHYQWEKRMIFADLPYFLSTAGVTFQFV